MMIAALCALLAGAVAGIFLAVRHFLRRRLPVWVALLHGMGGAIGFTLVLLAVVREPNFQPVRQALYLLIATVALGCVNLLFHVRRVRHRTSLIVMHALTAVSAVGTLIFAIFVHEPEGGAPPVPTQAPPNDAPPAVASAVPSGAPPAIASAAAAPPPSAAPAALSEATFSLDRTAQDVLAKPIRFGTNGVAVLAESGVALSDVAKILKQHAEIELVDVQGHADARGGEEHNLSLTRMRATVVLETLVSLGVARSRLRAAGYGARCPADPKCARDPSGGPCGSPETWNADRRVVFVPLRVASVPFKGEIVCPRGVELIPQEDRAFNSP
jgi:outer membrane protein OmpA-like peptidoglycan-associated protein